MGKWRMKKRESLDIKTWELWLLLVVEKPLWVLPFLFNRVEKNVGSSQVGSESPRLRSRKLHHLRTFSDSSSFVITTPFLSGRYAKTSNLWKSSLCSMAWSLHDDGNELEKQDHASLLLVYQQHFWKRSDQILRSCLSKRVFKIGSKGGEQLSHSLFRLSNIFLL